MKNLLHSVNFLKPHLSFFQAGNHPFTQRQGFPMYLSDEKSGSLLFRTEGAYTMLYPVLGVLGRNIHCEGLYSFCYEMNNPP